jgi:hypothetical protein
MTWLSLACGTLVDGTSLKFDSVAQKTMLVFIAGLYPKAEKRRPAIRQG